MRIFFLLAAISSIAQEIDLEESAVAKDSVPIRLTQQEEQMQNERTPAPQPNGSGCCPSSSTGSACCPIRCCKPPSPNCPPLQPYCDSCDCIIDHYNPLIFNGVDASIEWLYWTVQQKASTFVLTPHGFHQPFPASASTDGLGKYKYASFDWNSGVRAGLGYTFQRDAWHLLGQYTYYKTHGSNRATRPADLTLYLEATNKNINATAEGLDLITSNIHLHYQVADLLFSRRFLPGCQILFNFFTGATGAWINEKWKISAFDLNNITTIIRNNWRFRGGGIRVGFDTNWHIGSGVGFFNRFSVATLVGPFWNEKITVLQPTFPPQTNFTDPLGHTLENEVWVVPTTQIEFGLNWNRRFCDWSMNWTLAFEINTWYDLHQYHQSMQRTDPPNSNHLDYRNASDVSLWGLNLDFAFSF